MARFWVMGLLNNVIPMSLILWGQIRIGSGFAAILNASTPLFTVLLAHVFTRDERMTPNRVGGVLFGLAGVAVMIGPDALGGLSGDLAAQLAVLGAAVSYACADIFGRRLRGIPPLVTAAGQVTASKALHRRTRRCGPRSSAPTDRLGRLGPEVVGPQRTQVVSSQMSSALVRA